MSSKILYLVHGVVLGVAVGILIGKSFRGDGEVGTGGDARARDFRLQAEELSSGKKNDSMEKEEGGREQFAEGISELPDLYKLAEAPYSVAAKNLSDAVQGLSVEQLRDLANEMHHSRHYRRYQVSAAVYQRWVELDHEGLFAHADASPRRQMQEIYSNAFQYLGYSDPELAIRKFNSLTDHSLRNRLTYSLAIALGGKHADAGLRILKSVPTNWSGAHRNFFRTLAGDDPAGAAKHLEKIKRIEKRREAIEGILEVWAEGDPEAAFAWIEKLPEGSDRKAATRKYLQRLAVKDPQSAIRIAESKPLGSRAELIEDVVTSWVRDEPDAAIAYVKTLSPSMQGHVADDFASELSQHPEKSLALLKTLPSGRLRNDLITRTIDKLARFTPERAHELVATLDNRKERESAITKVAVSMSEHDPQAAADYLAKLRSEDRIGTHAYHMTAKNLANHDVNQAIDWAVELDSLENRHAALSSISGLMAELNPSYYVNLVASEENQERQKDLVNRGFSHLAENALEQAAQLVSQLPDNQRPAAMNHIIRKIANEDPIAAAGHIDTLIGDYGGDLRKNGLADSVRSIASNWSELEPEKATNWAASMPDEETRRAAVDYSVRSWIETDSLAASEWIGNLNDGATKDAAIGRLVYNVHADDPEAGLAWANSISDEKARSEKVEYVIMNWKAKDERAASEAVASGNFSEELTTKLLKILE